MSKNEHQSKNQSGRHVIVANQPVRQAERKSEGQIMGACQSVRRQSQGKGDPNEQQEMRRSDSDVSNQPIESEKQSHVRDRVRQLEDQIQDALRSPEIANMSTNSVLDSTGDSDQAFYSQYVQDKSPRKFNGINVNEIATGAEAMNDQSCDLHSNQYIPPLNDIQSDSSLDSSSQRSNSNDTHDTVISESTVTGSKQK